MTKSIGRTIYHTHVKYLVREKLLPVAVLSQIPRSNVQRWKNERSDKYKTFDLNLSTAADYELLREFAKHAHAKRIFAAYVRLIRTVLRIAHSLPAFHQAVRAHSAQVVRIVETVKGRIPLRRVLRFFNLSIHTIRNWSVRSHTGCFESMTGDCNRVYPNQLSRPEVLKLKELLTDSRFQYWPVSSIAFHALRHNLLPLSLNTWYKYVHKLGLKRPRPLSRRKKNTPGIRAAGPHQVWHADITTFVTGDNIKNYIYLVVDNFSRKILAWRVCNEIKAEIRRQTIEDALHAMNSETDITLITDGGPENNFKTLSHDRIDHRIALVDIQYSNSLIEAHNKLIKYNYLYRKEIPDSIYLEKFMHYIVDDFNNRPHVSLNGLTPNEVERVVSLDREILRHHVQSATENRKVYNLAHRCGRCK